MSKIFLTEQQAIELLPCCDKIHTFKQAVFGCLVGADWDREDVIDKIKKSDYREVTGNMARSLRHGLAVYNKEDTVFDMVFIETNARELDALYPEEET